VLHDLRFALRVLRKSRAFTAVVIVIMALGIGVNTAIFTIVNAVLFKGMPFDDPGEIAFLSSNRGGISYPDFIDLREQARSFRGLGAFNNVQADLSDGDTEAERVSGARLTANAFSLLGAQPLLGRDFTAADEQTGAERVALLSYALWQNRYNGAGDILGKTIRINLEEYTVVGVMRPGEAFPQDTKLWIPSRTSAPARSSPRSPAPWRRPIPTPIRTSKRASLRTRTAARRGRFG
jgi:putative ABC transport system permease protein